MTAIEARTVVPSGVSDSTVESMVFIAWVTYFSTRLLPDTLMSFTSTVGCPDAWTVADGVPPSFFTSTPNVA